MYDVQSWRIDWSRETTVKNWIVELDMHCSSNYAIGLFGSVYFIGYLASCFIFLPMADVYGRKFLSVMCRVGLVISFSLFLIFKGQVIYYVLVAIVGMFAPIISNVTYSHLIEFVPGREAVISGWLFAIDGSISFVGSPLVLMYITKDTTAFIYMGLGVNVICCVVYALWYFPESTKFLIVKGHFE